MQDVRALADLPADLGARVTLIRGSAGQLVSVPVPRPGSAAGRPSAYHVLAIFARPPRRRRRRRRARRLRPRSPDPDRPRPTRRRRARGRRSGRRAADADATVAPSRGASSRAASARARQRRAGRIAATRSRPRSRTAPESATSLPDRARASASMPSVRYGVDGRGARRSDQLAASRRRMGQEVLARPGAHDAASSRSRSRRSTGGLTTPRASPADRTGARIGAIPTLASIRGVDQRPERPRVAGAAGAVPALGRGTTAPGRGSAIGDVTETGRPAAAAPRRRTSDRPGDHRATGDDRERRFAGLTRAPRWIGASAGSGPSAALTGRSRRRRPTARVPPSAAASSRRRTSREFVLTRIEAP